MNSYLLSRQMFALSFRFLWFIGVVICRLITSVNAVIGSALMLNWCGFGNESCLKLLINFEILKRFKTTHPIRFIKTIIFMLKVLFCIKSGRSVRPHYYITSIFNQTNSLINKYCWNVASFVVEDFSHDLFKKWLKDNFFVNFRFGDSDSMPSISHLFYIYDHWFFLFWRGIQIARDWT